jgi:hypothetical protein
VKKGYDASRGKDLPGSGGVQDNGMPHISLVWGRQGQTSFNVANMPQLCVTAYGCLEGIWLPTLGYCCLSSTAYIDDCHYLDTISNNAVIINAHLCSHSEQQDHQR